MRKFFRHSIHISLTVSLLACQPNSLPIQLGHHTSPSVIPAPRNKGINNIFEAKAYRPYCDEDENGFSPNESPKAMACYASGGDPIYEYPEGENCKKVASCAFDLSMSLGELDDLNRLHINVYSETTWVLSISNKDDQVVFNSSGGPGESEVLWNTRLLADGGYDIWLRATNGTGDARSYYSILTTHCEPPKILNAENECVSKAPKIRFLTNFETEDIAEGDTEVSEFAARLITEDENSTSLSNFTISSQPPALPPETKSWFKYFEWFVERPSPPIVATPNNPAKLDVKGSKEIAKSLRYFLQNKSGTLQNVATKASPLKALGGPVLHAFGEVPHMSG